MSAHAIPYGRRDADPVRVTSDHRVVWYPSGVVGEGGRRSRRCSSAADAHRVATDIRAELYGRTVAESATPAASPQLGPSASAQLVPCLGDVMDAFVEHRTRSGTAVGTLRQYRSNWRVWVPAPVCRKRTHELEIADWAAIFDGLTYANAHARTVASVARTLGALITFGTLRGLIVTEPFALPRLRRHVVREAVARAAPTAPVRITPADCPSRLDVHAYADAFERHYPGYGRLMVLTAYASGLRICELLALRTDDIDLDAGLISVTKQLDRYEPWPAVRPPKTRRSRLTLLWSAYLPEMTELCRRAEQRSVDPHWLFPRHRSVTRWADQAGHLAAAAAADCDTWGWRHHWLRHSYATTSLASESSGGYGLDPKPVSEWLGHAKLSTTLNMYVARISGDVALARSLTSRLPGTGIEDV